jgi:hypothetical protein
MTTYTLTAAEAKQYDDGDAESACLMRKLVTRFGPFSAGEPVAVEVRHPDGFVVSAHTTAA